MSFPPSGSGPDAPGARSRRRFVQGLAAGGAVAGFGLWSKPLWALKAPDQPQVLTGTRFDLSIGETPVNFTGRARAAVTVNGQLPAPLAALARRRHGRRCASPTAAGTTRPRSTGTASCCRPTWTACRASASTASRRARRFIYRFPVKPGRHLLVSQPFALPGTGRPVRPDRHRAARRRAVSRRPRPRGAAVRLDRRRSRAHLRRR